MRAGHTRDGVEPLAGGGEGAGRPRARSPQRRRRRRCRAMYFFPCCPAIRRCARWVWTLRLLDKAAKGLVHVNWRPSRWTLPKRWRRRMTAAVWLMSRRPVFARPEAAAQKGMAWCWRPERMTPSTKVEPLLGRDRARAPCGWGNARNGQSVQDRRQFHDHERGGNYGRSLCPAEEGRRRSRRCSTTP